MNLIIYARDPLVFRDGRPFGEFGAVRSGAFSWPMPATVAGMLRSRIGLNRHPDFFRQPDGADRVRAIHIAAIQPTYRIDNEKWRLAYPKPADVLVCPGEDDQLFLYGFDYAAQGENGVTLPWKNCLIPLPKTNEKPAQLQPAFWHEEAYMKWLLGPETMNEPMPADALGWLLPDQDHRIHCAIDGVSGASADGQLWTSAGLCMQGRDTNGRLRQWGIAAGLKGYEKSDRADGAVHLGGDRRLAFVEKTDIRWPVCPQKFAGARFLRLILLSPGAFGGWAPEWLLPADASNHSRTPWVKVPGTNHEMRICSAFVPRWTAVSGWDYAARRPKAMRKLVPAGAVYVVEIKDPTASQAIAEHLWGKPLDPNETDGHGICMVGCTNINP